MNYELYGISAAKLRALHTFALSRDGGSEGERDPDGIDGVVGATITSALYFRSSDSPDILAFVAFLTIKIAMGHYFIDGNKRLAWTSLIVALGSRYYSLDASEDEAIQIIGKICDHAIDAENLIDWISERVTEVAQF